MLTEVKPRIFIFVSFSPLSGFFFWFLVFGFWFFLDFFSSEKRFLILFERG